MKWYVWTFLALVLALMAFASWRGQDAFPWIEHVPGQDKTGHFLIMGALAFLANLSLSARRIRVGPVSVLLGSVLVFAFVTVEEFSQIFIATRSFSLGDLACDYAGILFFGYLAERVVRRRQARGDD